MNMDVRAHARASEEQRRREEGRENRNFVQVYPQGWERLRSLMTENPTAAKVYAVLAEHIDPSCGAVVVSQDVLAELVGVSERTIRRATTYLEEARALVRIRVSGSVYAYALNPAEVWRAWDSQKDHAAFITRTLVKKKGQDKVARRLQLMLRDQAGEPELPLEADDEG